MRKPNLFLAKSDGDVETDLTMSSRALGEKRYELTNHLGKVLAVYERRSYHSGTDNYTPEQYTTILFN